MIWSSPLLKKSPAWMRGFLLVSGILSGLFFQRVIAEEQQSQGYRFEHAVIFQFTGRDNVETSYTGEWDIPAEFNTVTGSPISIKCIRWGNSVYLGDALRQRKLSEPFEMVVGFYEADKVEGMARLKAVHYLKVIPEKWHQWWGEITLAEIEELSAGIKKKPLAEAQAFARERAKQLRAKAGIIDLNPKVNKDQRRIQCSIPFKLFYEEVLQQEMKEQAELKLLGKPFPQSFPLGARSRAATVKE